MVEKWKCIVCGYIHEGNTPPEVCPVCGVGCDKFEKVSSEKNDNNYNDMNKTTLWRCTVCGFLYEGETPPGKCPICNVNSEFFEKVNQYKNYVSKSTISLPNISNKKSSKKWRCTICGYIYEGDNPPTICPVCGVDSDKFEEVLDDKKDNHFNSTFNGTVVILGNGIAGLSAAKSIRERNSTCSIYVISEENYLTYYRPQLSSLLGKNISEEKILVSPLSWYKENNINLILNSKALNIDINNKKVVLKNSENLQYDKLILATGSSSFIPPIKGIDKKGVFSLRNIEDLKSINSYMQNIEKVVIIGGGLLGLEAAASIKEKNIKVTVVEKAPRLLPRQLDNNGSTIFKDIVLNSNIDILCDEGVEEILGEDVVNSVKLSNNKTLPCDMVLVSIGIRSNKGIAEEAGIKTNRGILVNERMETSEKDIYACGDVAEYKNSVFGNWISSDEMGYTAGANAMGDNYKFKNFITSTMFQSLNTSIFSCGNIAEASNEEYFEFSKPKEKLYKKYLFNDNIIKGAILIGNIADSNETLSYIKNAKTLKDVLENIKDTL